MTSRQRRGRDTELRLAEWLREHGHPDAQAGGCYAPGIDVTGTRWGGIEVKARTRLEPLAWLRQSPSGLVVFRPNGLGDGYPGLFLALLTVDRLNALTSEGPWPRD